MEDERFVWACPFSSSSTSPPAGGPHGQRTPNEVVDSVANETVQRDAPKVPRQHDMDTKTRRENRYPYRRPGVGEFLDSWGGTPPAVTHGPGRAHAVHGGVFGDDPAVTNGLGRAHAVHGGVSGDDPAVTHGPGGAHA
eukprot:14634680-Heterocapsa_arctica.AAC.1